MEELRRFASSNLFSSCLMALVDSPNSDARLRRYPLALLFMKNLIISFIRVLEVIKLSNITLEQDLYSISGCNIVQKFNNESYKTKKIE